MKKIILTIILLGAISPVFAVCSITGGACSALTSPNLQEKYVPDNLQNMQKPDAFAPGYFKPYQDIMLNTETRSTATGAASPASNYNSNCQFGVCLPGETSSEILPEF